MPGGEATPEKSSPASRWREAAERLRSTARVFVVSLGAVAVTVVAGLSLTGLSTLDPRSANFAFAVAGALLATLGVVVMLALAMRLSSASAVSMAELLALRDSGASTKRLWWRRRLRPGHMYARRVVDAKSNGYLAGYDNLEAFNDAVAEVHLDERTKADDAAKAPKDPAVYAQYKAASIKAASYDARLRSLVEVASFQRLRWNFGATAGLMTVAGAVTAVGIVMYAAALQPRGVPSSPVAVTMHESIRIKVPESNAAAALYESVVGCAQSVGALVVGVSDASVSAITVPEDACRSVTLTAVWDGTGYVAKFDLPEETEKPQPSATP
ncbi:hypothetical protein QFZ79_003065 [Arthrobacter sp. V4I6]|nr:hypothetical protein [Arthrobacter sp. V1I7]MDQ0854954.1 hypothetical protein [Arthrobacter sp. V4I6]